jgi:tetratricopeptide (TPR) repeat protein
MGSSGRDGWVLAAAAAARLGQFAQMGELLSAAERQPPGYASPHRELLALQVHSLQRAHRQLRAITGSEVPLAAGEALEHLAVAEARFAEGDLEGAAEGFLAALSIDASTIDAWVELGVVLQKAGLIEAAEEALRTAVGLWPEGLDARLNLAMLFWESGRPAEAVGELRHLARRVPEHEEVLGLLAGVGVQAPLSTLALLPGGRGSAQLSALAAAMQRRGWRVQPVQEAVLAALSPRGRVDPLAGLPALIEATGAHLVLLDPADPRCGRWRAALPDGVPVLLTTDEAASEEERLPAPRIAPPSVARPLISVVLPRQASLEQVEDWLDAIALQELPPALVELLVEAEHDDELPVGGRPCGLRRISDSGAAAQGRAAGRVVLAADPALPPAPNTLLRYLSALG